LKKYAFKDDGTVDGDKLIAADELKAFVYMVVTYVDYINDKPVFIMQLKNEMRKVKNNVDQLQKTTMNELGRLSDYV